eukprot:383606-Prymnesium_polylepis.4
MASVCQRAGHRGSTRAGPHTTRALPRWGADRCNHQATMRNSQGENEGGSRGFARIQASPPTGQSAIITRARFQVSSYSSVASHFACAVLKRAAKERLKDTRCSAGNQQES